jgi:starvation-inducible DNA-binding protein
LAKRASNTAVVGELSVLLASSYTLYLKTQNYHWNVTGPMFATLHTLFETQYTELAAANDEIAERIRALDAFAPGSLAEFSKLSVVKEARGRSTAKEMIQTLVADQRAVARAAHEVIDAAEKSGDQATVDLGTRRVNIHEKNAWMLQSHLE